jgi:hypothetical protein
MAAAHVPYPTLSTDEEKRARQLVRRAAFLKAKAELLVEDLVSSFECDMAVANHAAASTLSDTLESAFAIVINPTLKDLVRGGRIRPAQEPAQQPAVAANIAGIEALTALPNYRKLDSTYSAFRNIAIAFFQHLVSGTAPPVSQAEQAANASVLEKIAHDFRNVDGEDDGRWNLSRATNFVDSTASLLRTFSTYPTVNDFVAHTFQNSRPPHPHFPDLFAKYGMGPNADEVGTLWALVRLALEQLFGWPDPNPHGSAGGDRRQRQSRARNRRRSAKAKARSRRRRSPKMAK